jgi:hypothetical protein
MTDKPDEQPVVPILPISLDMDKIKENLPSYSSEKLCEMIVCDRYLGFGQKIQTICMEELAKRRIAGDAFDFESYIANAHKQLPVLDFKKDIRDVLKQAMGRIKK